MFGLFKTDPIKKLVKKYENLMEKGVHAQRNGDIELYAKLSSEAEAVLKELDELRKNQGN